MRKHQEIRALLACTTTCTSLYYSGVSDHPLYPRAVVHSSAPPRGVIGLWTVEYVDMSARDSPPGDFIVTLRPRRGIAPYRALRAGLKTLLRRHGLRAVTVRLEPKKTKAKNEPQR